jgi:hypothetical protein
MKTFGTILVQCIIYLLHKNYQWCNCWYKQEHGENHAGINIKREKVIQELVWLQTNKQEHGENHTGINIKREKVIQELVWLQTKVQDVKNSPYRNITEEKLQKTPIANLLMMVDQLTRIKKTYEKNNNKNETGKENIENEATIEINNEQENEWNEQLRTK